MNNTQYYQTTFNCCQNKILLHEEKQLKELRNNRNTRIDSFIITASFSYLPFFSVCCLLAWVCILALCSMASCFCFCLLFCPLPLKEDHHNIMVKYENLVTKLCIPCVKYKKRNKKRNTKNAKHDIKTNYDCTSNNMTVQFWCCIKNLKSKKTHNAIHYYPN